MLVFVPTPPSNLQLSLEWTGIQYIFWIWLTRIDPTTPFESKTKYEWSDKQHMFRTLSLKLNIVGEKHSAITEYTSFFQQYLRTRLVYCQGEIGAKNESLSGMFAFLTASFRGFKTLTVSHSEWQLQFCVLTLARQKMFLYKILCAQIFETFRKRFDKFCMIWTGSENGSKTVLAK